MPSTDTVSPVTTVLSTPNLLYRIFSSCPKKANAKNLLVNKVWAEEVLNLEWYRVNQVEWLLGLLAPLVAIEHDFFTFIRLPEAADWERFYRYAPRVKVLIHQWNMFDASVYNILSAYQSQHHALLLPNVEHLSCLIDTDSLGVFLRPGLSSLTLCYDLDRYCIDLECLQLSLPLVTRTVASSLTNLTFNYLVEDDLLTSAEDFLVPALGEMKKLTWLDICPYWLSDRVTQSLAALPSLRELEAESYMYTHTTSIVPTFSTSLDSNSFRLLTDLSLSIPFEMAISSFTSWSRSARLNSLTLQSDRFELPEDYQTMVTIIVKTFPSLQTLSIDANAIHIPLNIPNPRLTFQALKPILRLQGLQSLRVSYVTPLHITHADLSDIFWELESITSLELNPTPTIRTTSILHLTSLVTAHLAASHLQILRLYLDTSLKGFKREMDPMLRESLDGFDCLDVGVSALSGEAVGSVVEFLSLLLPEGCTIKAARADGMYDERETPPEWGRVCSFVTALAQATRLGDIGEVCRLRIALAAT